MRQVTRRGHGRDHAVTIRTPPARRSQPPWLVRRASQVVEYFDQGSLTGRAEGDSGWLAVDAAGHEARSRGGVTGRCHKAGSRGGVTRRGHEAGSRGGSRSEIMTRGHGREPAGD